MKIVISGKTGFIGSRMAARFGGAGHTVQGLSREDFKKGEGHLASIISGCDVLINLAGAPIIKKWTRSYCRELWDSRILTTRQLTDAMAACEEKPHTFISASAVGFYANNGIHTEENFIHNEDFLGILCQRWEEEASRARIHCRTYIMRLGIAMGKQGGALPQMVKPFRMYAGGKIGSGEQMISWIHIEDLLRAVEFIFTKRPDRNVFNLTAPHPVSNADLTRIIARTLNKPAVFTMPATALRILYGEGAVTLLEGQHVLPENLQKEGFTFLFPYPEDAMVDLLRKKD
jgi:uncharacterized protein